MVIEKQSYLQRAGLYLGIIGTVSVLFFVLIFLEDWTRRFSFILILIPLPIIFLYIARKFQFIGGLLLVILGIALFIFDLYNYPGNPGQIAGMGSGYTIVFVSLPLITSGTLFIIYRIKNRRSAIDNKK
jgi:hypothetical protein